MKNSLKRLAVYDEAAIKAALKGVGLEATELLDDDTTWLITLKGEPTLSQLNKFTIQLMGLLNIPLPAGLLSPNKVFITSDADGVVLGITNI